jgi:hypothetical protein
MISAINDQELERCLTVAKDNQKIMIRAYGKKHPREVGFAISRYNAILKKAGPDKKYFLGAAT